MRHFNILVGPNNAGKSTVLAAFRILAAGMRKAVSRKAEPVEGPSGNTFGYRVDLRAISVAEENIFFDYDDSEPASVDFTLSNKNQLKLYFPEQGVCNLIAGDRERAITTPTLFRSRFNCPIGFVPILGPVDHTEYLYERDAARQALFSYRAARNFRNIWHHYPAEFEMFRELLRETWPGMDILPPEIGFSNSKPVLHMFCPEERVPREIFWSGFGFQVWCQMLTHLVQSKDKSLFLVDEPDIYLHSDLQRQLLGLLKDLGPDVLIATHSTEIITEAESDDIVLVDKHRARARRIKDPGELVEVFAILGSNLNPTLTQIAKTRRAVFVEGNDFQLLAKFARRLGLRDVANRSRFAVVPVGGFNPDRIRALKRGMETTLGGSIGTAAVLDKDYRSKAECLAIESTCAEFCDLVVVHGCKEVESFLLVPEALDRAARRRYADRERRTGKTSSYEDIASSVLLEFAASQKSYVTSQYLASQRRFVRVAHPSRDEATTNQAALDEFEREWEHEKRQLEIVPGKEALGFLNQRLQDRFGISITPTAIIDAMHPHEIPQQVSDLLARLGEFSKS